MKKAIVIIFCFCSWLTAYAEQLPTVNAFLKSTNIITAVGDTGLISVSSDGYSWNRITAITNNNINAVVRYKSSYIAVTGAGQPGNSEILRSADGLVWNKSSSGTAASLRALVSTYSSIIAVGDGGVILRSADGVTWSNSIASPYTLRSITWDGLNLFACGDVDNSGFSTVITSGDDGLSWHRINIQAHESLNAIARYDGGLLVVGANGFIATSPLPVPQWTIKTIPSAGNLNAIDENIITGITVFGDASILESFDSTVWGFRYQSAFAGCRAGKFIGDAYIGNLVAAGCANGRILLSRNELQWQSISVIDEIFSDGFE